MADLIYMTKAAWTAITDVVRGKTGKTGLLKATDIPYALSGLIGTDALFDGAGVTKISSDTKTTTRSYMCYGFTELQEIDLPSATTIDGSAFSNCSSLATVNLPNVTRIGTGAFSSGANFNGLTLPKVENIQADAFAWGSPVLPKDGNRSTGKLTLGNIKYIGATAFYKNGFSEVDITVNSSGGNIGDMSFMSCDNLTKLTIRGTAMLSIDDKYAFYSTPIYKKQGKIYVDASMVDTYKTATNWDFYSSIIEAI